MRDLLIVIGVLIAVAILGPFILLFAGLFGDE